MKPLQLYLAEPQNSGLTTVLNVSLRIQPLQLYCGEPQNEALTTVLRGASEFRPYNCTKGSLRMKPLQLY